MTLDKSLERFGKMGAAGWGDRVLMGILVGYLEKANPHRLRDYIRDNTRLLDTISESDLKLFKRMGKAMNIQTVSAADILKVLQEEASSISVILEFHPKGVEWLESQVADIKKTLLA